MDEIAQEEYVEGEERRAQHWRSLRREAGMCEERKARFEVEPTEQRGAAQHRSSGGPVCIAEACGSRR